MIITRFEGEMLFSNAIRMERLSNGRPIRLASLPFSTNLYGNHISSLRLPAPKWTFGQEYELLDTYIEATAWPLLALLKGVSIQEILNLAATGWPKLFSKARARTESHVRFCRNCAEEQRKRFSVSWWVRDLNLPMVSVCPIHGSRLYYVERNLVLDESGFLPHEMLKVAHKIPGHVDDEAIEIADFVITLCRKSAQLDSARLSKCASELRSIQFTNLNEKLSRSTVIWAIPNGCSYVTETHEQWLSSDFHLDYELVVLAIARKSLPSFTYLQNVGDQLPTLRSGIAFEDVITGILTTTRFLRFQPDRRGCLIKALKRRCEERCLYDAGKNISIEVLLLNVLDPPWISHWLKSQTPELRRILSFSPDYITVGMYILHRSLLSLKHCSKENLERCPFVRRLCKFSPPVSLWGVSVFQSWVDNAKPFLSDIRKRATFGLGP
jgi:hypothetical protein